MHVHLFACMQDTSMAAEEGLRFEREPYLLAFDTPSLARVLLLDNSNITLFFQNMFICYCVLASHADESIATQEASARPFAPMNKFFPNVMNTSIRMIKEFRS